MIWIFLPAFNEESALPKLMKNINKTMQRKKYRIVVVDDGSIDRTAKILTELAANFPLDIITHPINRGLGETERDGFEYIAAHSRDEDVVVRVEADDTHDPKYILNLITKLSQGYDVVNTSRFQPGGGQIGVDAYRAFISRAANVFMKMVFGIKGVNDFSCGFRAYRAQIIKDALAIYGNYLVQLKGLGFTSTLEIIVKLYIMGCRFTEVPFVLRYDRKQGSSKMVGSVTTLGYLIMAVLYLWPFGGWRAHYRGLGDLYRIDRIRAIEKYRLGLNKHHHLPTKINS